MIKKVMSVVTGKQKKKQSKKKYIININVACLTVRPTCLLLYYSYYGGSVLPADIANTHTRQE